MCVGLCTHILNLTCYITCKHAHTFTCFKFDLTLSKIRTENFSEQVNCFLFGGNTLKLRRILILSVTRAWRQGLASEGCLPCGMVQTKFQKMCSFKELTEELPKRIVKTSKAFSFPVCVVPSKTLSLPGLPRLPLVLVKALRDEAAPPSPAAAGRSGLLLPFAAQKCRVFLQSHRKGIPCRPHREPREGDVVSEGTHHPGLQSRSLGSGPQGHFLLGSPGSPGRELVLNAIRD